MGSSDDRAATLAGQMSDESAQLLCMARNGSEILTPPPGLAHWSERTFGTVGDRPLDLLVPDSQSHGVGAFLAAVSDGHASTVVELVDVDGNFRLEAFDVTVEHDCMIFVLTPTAESPNAPPPKPQSLPPVRRATARMDGNGTRLWVDENFERMLGYSSGEALGGSTADDVHPDDVERAFLEFGELLQNPGVEQRLRLRMKHKDGRWIWTELTRVNLLETSDPHIRTEALDISAEMSAQVALEEREALLARLTEALPIGIVYFAESGEIDLVNDRWAALTGSEPTGTLKSLIDDTFEDTWSLLATLDADRAEGRDTSMVVHYTNPDLGRRHGRLRRQLVLLHGDASTGAAGRSLLTLDDITETFDFQREQARQVRTDHLTQSLNRMGIEEQIVTLLAEPHEPQLPLHLLYFDLDGFKSINDTHGHSAGDVILQTTVKHIQGVVRTEDLVGRLGGDEFVAVLRGLEPGQGAAVGNRIQSELLAQAGISVSVGMAVAEPDDDFDRLVGRADQSMYEDKARRSHRSNLS